MYVFYCLASHIHMTYVYLFYSLALANWEMIHAWYKYMYMYMYICKTKTDGKSI